MKPYYADESVTLYHGDCREVTAWLEADVLVTDPPYGMGYVESRSTTRGNKFRPIVADNDPTLRETALQMWHGTPGVVRPALVFGTWRIDRPRDVTQLIVWDKGDSPGMGDLTLPWGPAHEELYVIGSGWSGKRRPNIYRVPTLPPASANRPNHPTPKPVTLMEQLLAYCPPGTIADPFAGSGATLLAARNDGRKAIGVELDEAYCELIARRLDQGVLDFGGVA